MINLAILDNAQSRSISPENFQGEKGKGGMAVPTEEGHPAGLLGQGWKVSPKVRIGGGETFAMADIDGPGTIEHIWLTPSGVPWRFLILRVYWDDQDISSVECPLGNSGWWGEGEIKFFLDGDGEFPTICGTGTEDYFCGSYNFENRREKRYQEFTTPYVGMPQVLRPDGLYESQTRFSLYRWHIPDPIRFHEDLRVNIQALGWRGKMFLPLQDDIASVSFWYQTLPTAPFPALADRDTLQII